MTVRSARTIHTGLPLHAAHAAIAVAAINRRSAIAIGRADAALDVEAVAATRIETRVEVAAGQIAAAVEVAGTAATRDVAGVGDVIRIAIVARAREREAVLAGCRIGARRVAEQPARVRMIGEEM